MSLKNLEQIEIFGSPLVNFADLGELILRLGIDLLVILIVVRLIFYPLYRQKNYLFTYVLINISVFLTCILLNTIKLKIGFAFGLFAVFSIIRYRTEPIPIKEMTYLFLSIIVAVINALSAQQISYVEMLSSNTIIIASVYVLEKCWLKKRDAVKEVKYEKIELLKPERYKDLINDLKERTGLDIQRVDVDTINFMNDTAYIKIYYKEFRSEKSEKS